MINTLIETVPIVKEAGEEAGQMERRFQVWTRNVVRDASVGDWQDVTFENSWVNFGSTFNDAQFRSIGDKQVQLRGIVKDGTVGSGFPVFTLPEGFRPVKDYIFPVVSNNALGRIDVEDTGGVEVVIGSNVFVSLDGILFSLD